MAVPKKRKSHSRTRTQRAHDHLTRPGWVTCAQCQEPKLLHHVCAACGFYRGREIFHIEPAGAAS